jgi:dipeptide/tripeptide permease
MINIGSLTGIVTTLLESRIGFGVAFMIPLVFIVLGMVIFIFYSKVFGRYCGILNPSKV